MPNNAHKLTRTELIEYTFNLQDASSIFLLLLRVVLDQEKPGNNLRQDIYDLGIYPERLEGSYHDEWRTYIKRHLHKNAFTDASLSDAEALMTYLQSIYESRLALIQEDFAEYDQIIERTILVNNSDNVMPIQHRLKNTLNMLMQP